MTDQMEKTARKRSAPILTLVSFLLTLGMLAVILYTGAAETADEDTLVSNLDFAGRYAGHIRDQQLQFLSSSQEDLARNPVILPAAAAAQTEDPTEPPAENSVAAVRLKAQATDVDERQALSPEEVALRLAAIEMQKKAAASSAAPKEQPQEQEPQIRKLSDDDLVAPIPDPSAYGAAQSPEELTDFFLNAAPVMEGQPFYFSADRERMPGSQIRYFLDDSIAVISWKEIYNNTVLTFAEVKIMDGSQFRRFLAGGKFGASPKYYTTEMAHMVNAVLASSGDFYAFRFNGVVVYDGLVRRVKTYVADTCYINDEGDLLFTYRNIMMSDQEAQDFVDDNHIRFSLTFGPVLVDDGVQCDPSYYGLGQIESFSPRAALCQMDRLHYLLVTSNAENPYGGALTMHQFADRIAATGCRKAYALDGGQTAALALDGELLNNVLFGEQRAISDIIYFATSVGG